MKLVRHIGLAGALAVGVLVPIQTLGAAAAQASPTVHEYALPAGTSDYFSITGDPQTGDVYFGGFASPGIAGVGKITPDGDITMYPMDLGSSEAWPGNTMAMHDGDVWFGVTNSSWYGYMHFNSDGSTSFDHFFAKSGVGSMWTPDPATGPIFFADGQYLGKLDFSGGDLTPIVSECTLAPFSTGAGSMTGDPDNGMLYFTNGSGVGEASQAIPNNAPCSGVSTINTPTPNSATSGITIGGDGRVWFGEYHNAGIGAVSESLSGIVEYPTGGYPTAGATGPDGKVYFTDQVLSRIIQMQPNGTPASFFTVTGNANPTVIALGPDNALWWPELHPEAIGQLVVTQPTKTTLKSKVNPATYGQKGRITATVKSVPPGSTPTGDVEFDVNGLPFETDSLDGAGRATMAIADLEVGSYSITATYLGDANFSPSTSKTLNQAVDPANTAVDLASSMNPAPHGSAGAITATIVVAPPGDGTPTGTVTFKVDGVAQSPVPLSNGKAKLKLKQLAVGSHQILAVYSGSIDFNSSTSPPFTQVIT